MPTIFLPLQGHNSEKRLAVIKDSGEDCVCMHMFTCIYSCVYVFLFMHSWITVHLYPTHKTCRFFTMQRVWIWVDLLKTDMISTWYGDITCPPPFSPGFHLVIVCKIGTTHSVAHSGIVIWCTDACNVRHYPGMSEICVAEENDMQVL